MAGWHHGLDEHESEWTAGDGDGQGGLASCDSWGRKESDTTERLNWGGDSRQQCLSCLNVVVDVRDVPGHSPTAGILCSKHLQILSSFMICHSENLSAEHRFK